MLRRARCNRGLLRKELPVFHVPEEAFIPQLVQFILAMYLFNGYDGHAGDNSKYSFGNRSARALDPSIVKNYDFPEAGAFSLQACTVASSRMIVSLSITYL